MICTSAWVALPDQFSSDGLIVRFIPYDQFIVDPVLYQNAINQGANPMTVGGIEYAPRPMDAAAYVQRVVLPRHRRIDGQKVVHVEDLPKVAEAIDKSQPHVRQMMAVGGRELRYSAARVRVEYSVPGRPTPHEDIYAVLNISWSPAANENARRVGLAPQEFILCDRIYSDTAPRGELELATGYMDKVIFSLRPEAEWLKFIGSIQRQVDGIALNQYAMEQAAPAQITASQRQTIEASWKAAEKPAEQVGELLGGRQ